MFQTPLLPIKANGYFPPFEQINKHKMERSKFIRPKITLSSLENYNIFLGDHFKIFKRKFN